MSRIPNLELLVFDWPHLEFSIYGRPNPEFSTGRQAQF